MKVKFLFYLLFFNTLYAQSFRPLAHSNFFYSHSHENLEAFLLEHIGSISHRKPSHSSMIIIAPHAGYNHSGSVAAQVYKKLKGQTFDHIVLLGPCHDKNIKNASVYWDYRIDHWENALQDHKPITIDPLAKVLAGHLNNPMENSYSIHQKEYSLERHLPFIAWVFPSMPIIPILLNKINNVDPVITALLDLFKEKKVLYIISTDFSHKLPPKEAEEQDKETIDLISQKDPEVFYRIALKENYRLCGTAAMYVALRLRKALFCGPFQWIAYGQGGEDGQVTGYASAVTR